jgi:hypothetical protein
MALVKEAKKKYLGIRDNLDPDPIRIQIYPDYQHYIVSRIVKYIYCRGKMYGMSVYRTCVCRAKQFLAPDPGLC